LPNAGSPLSTSGAQNYDIDATNAPDGSLKIVYSLYNRSPELQAK
jgi:hypothetical protein